MQNRGLKYIHSHQFQSDLLGCLVQCLVKSELQAADIDDPDDGDAAGTEQSQVKEEIREILESLSQRMAKCELEDFELVRFFCVDMLVMTGIV